MNYTIDDMKESDWQQVSEIYLEGIRTGIATFFCYHISDIIVLYI